jgi:hypothetical protein
MIMDMANLMSDKQALTTGTQLSTNAIDLWNGQASLPQVPLQKFAPQAGGGQFADPGRGGEPVQVWIQVNTAFTGGTSLQPKLVMADDAALSTNLTILDETPAVVEASLVSGYRFRLSGLPAGLTQRYLGIQYVTVGTHGAGTVTAGLVIDAQDVGIV